MSRNLKILSVALFTWALGAGLFFFFTPLYLEELGASAVQIGVVLALYALGQAVSMIPAGIAADRWGSRPVMIGGWLLGTVAAAIMAGAGRMWVFALGWLLYGISGWVMPPINRYIAAGREKLPPERALTLVLAAFPAGLIISNIIGGLVGARFGLQANFFLATFVFTISTTIVLFVSPQAAHPAARERSYRSLLRNRRFVGFMGVVFLAMLGMWLGMPLAPNFLQARWGMDVAAIGLLGAANSVGEVVLGITLGRRSPRRAFIALQAASMIYLLIILNTGQLAWLAIGFFLRAGSFIGLQFVDATSTRVVAAPQLGLAFGISGTIGMGASIIAPTIAGWLYATRPTWPFLLGLALLPITIGLTYLFAPRAVAVDSAPAADPQSAL